MSTIELTERVTFPFVDEDPAYGARLVEPVEFNDGDIHSLIDFIITQYHFTTRQKVVVIYDLAQQVFFRHGEKYPELAQLVEALFLFFDDLLFHLKREEQILFPNIIRLTEKKLRKGSFDYSTFGVIKECTLTMQDEHRDVVKQLAFFRRLTDNYTRPEDDNKLCRSLFAKMKEFENEMMQYIRLENDFLFPRAIQMDEN